MRHFHIMIDEKVNKR